MEHDAKVANFLHVSSLATVLRRKKLIIWDFDGTFCDTEPIHFMAYQSAFRPFGHVIQEEEYYLRFTQLESGLKEEIKVYGLPINESQARDLFLEKKRVYADLIGQGRAQPFPEIGLTLERLRMLDLKWVIASNSDAQQISLILDQLGRPFNECPHVIGPTQQLKKKPSGDLFREALKLTGATKDEALVLEDTAKGLAAAQEAGLEAILIHTRYNEGVYPEEPHIGRCSHHELLEALSMMSS